MACAGTRVKHFKRHLLEQWRVNEAWVGPGTPGDAVRCEETRSAERKSKCCAMRDDMELYHEGQLSHKIETHSQFGWGLDKTARCS